MITPNDKDYIRSMTDGHLKQTIRNFQQEVMDSTSEAQRQDNQEYLDALLAEQQRRQTKQ